MTPVSQESPIVIAARVATITPQNDDGVEENGLKESTADAFRKLRKTFSCYEIIMGSHHRQVAILVPDDKLDGFAYSRKKLIRSKTV